MSPSRSASSMRSPAHQPRAIRHGVPGLHDDGVLGDTARRLDAGRGPLGQLPVVDEGDVRPAGILADHLPHRPLQVPPALVVGIPADHVLYGELGARTAVVAVVHHLEGQAGQRFEVLGWVVDGGAGGDDPQGLELGHQLPALLLQAVQQVEAVGAQGAVVGVGLVQDQKRQVRDEPAHVVLGVLDLPEVVAQGGVCRREVPSRPSATVGSRRGSSAPGECAGGSASAR